MGYNCKTSNTWVSGILGGKENEEIMAENLSNLVEDTNLQTKKSQQPVWFFCYGVLRVLCIFWILISYQI